MKLLVFISQFLLFAGFAFAQEYRPYNTFNKEAELQKFVERGGKVEEISPDVYKLTSRAGESRTFYLRQKENQYETNQSVDTTVINIWEMDTTKFAGMFTFWQQVQVANSLWAPLPIEDLNNNNQPELYGYSDYIFPNPVFRVKIFERNLNGVYQDIFSYDTSTVLVKGISDINKDGNKEIIIASLDSDEVFFFYPIYKSDSTDVLPTTLDFFFYLDTLQINNMIFGDWDNNGIPDCAYTTDSGWDTTRCAIAEFRDSINEFEEIFRFASVFESNLSGFAIDDFDLDGKTELVVSSGPGNVFVIENKNENEYSIVSQFPFPVPNTYMQTATKDIDGNGKPEFWIGGQDFEEGITVYQCYEADGDNNYKSIARIELRYSTSFGTNCIQAVDTDNDGKEELVISSGNIILILKFVSSPDNQKYKLWYAKLGEATQPGAQFYPVAVADLDGDRKKDLVIPMGKNTPSIIYNFSYILKQDKPNNINEPFYNEKTFEIIKCYPNPFNSESTISFNVIVTSNVQIKIFNSLGKEINLLLNKELSPGNYNILWDARDKFGNSLSSGVYLIVLRTKNSVKTFKSILLK
jgi:hypothetical protein